jgi:hypothetical protein
MDLSRSTSSECWHSKFSGPFELLSLVVFCDNILIDTLAVLALCPLYSLHILCKLALRLAGPPDWQVAFEDIVDLFQSTASGLRVREEDVEDHCKTQYSKHL